MFYRGRLFGLQLRSEIPLPELGSIPADDNLPIDVEIRLAPVASPPAAVAFMDMKVCVLPESTFLEIPQVGRFQVIGGREILVDILPECSPEMLRLFLLGSTCGAMLYQRGMLPLHANAIEVDGRVFAFAGPSGGGKSTLAAYFNDRGYRVLCDDVCAISFTEDGAPQAWPGLPRLKLWADALHARGEHAIHFDRITQQHDKYNIPVQTVAAGGPFALTRLYNLQVSDDDSQLEPIVRLASVDALNVVVSNIYRRRLAELSPDPRRHLRQVANLIKHTEIYAVKRRWGYDEFLNEAERIERHLRA